MQAYFKPISLSRLKKKIAFAPKIGDTFVFNY